ncbi:MAG: hypothetical protein QOK37_3695 [Thermoanaerobaculia bacterium]|jgi:hypothetical protein|nr:hypothetical protein [Thermoanaerobaculia bacterium]
MKKVAVLLMAAAAAGYLYYRSSHAPETLYKAFAKEVLHRHYEAAAAMTDGLTAAQLERSGTQEKIGAGPAMFQTLFPSRFTIESRERSSDGTITMKAVQTVLFNPPGVESAMRASMMARMNQTVSMRKISGDWKIVSFENSFGSMDSLAAR